MIQLRSLPSLIPRSLATLAIDWPGPRAIELELWSEQATFTCRFTEDTPMVVIPSYQIAPLNPGNFKFVDSTLSFWRPIKNFIQNVPFLRFIESSRVHCRNVEFQRRIPSFPDSSEESNAGEFAPSLAAISRPRYHSTCPGPVGCYMKSPMCEQEEQIELTESSPSLGV